MTFIAKIPALLIAVLSLTTLNSVAQTTFGGNTNTTFEKKDPAVTIEDIGWMDKNKISQEVAKINELAQLKLGTSLRTDMSDLDTLQRIIDRDLVKREDYATQQAMGVALGQVFLADFPQTLEWKVYRDNVGRSRALCAKGTQQCFFPVTMLSRRMEVGSKPDVKKIYVDAIDLMKEYLPKIPYTDGEVLHRLPRQ
ncbi:DUF3806 domain-containing protein [Cellvibrio japonicus]|uniref:DUF3806 domain-containing protein n=1 Tax=Cellvibrio japonicus (strain Ueda107) TaxID=498211 RepID=B3PHH4_CELJU|nr:DUF3806 domain-containing protein [Cellvibrio japonicus]ACE83495.1 hypothetical protein CJA_1974 [Cellvibrio japonicus Ueda107]QEI12453.1 DUF3806 domain-containing protein [Cellvibrio japonicus]QEI16027.1 DUF3806 domain-containing protein [Cellvibrio japonicus]QEI19605.1 DUF3806 domain-containing protein [Cellvibrio japonicus]